MNRHTYPIKMRENEGKLFSAQCVTNGSSNCDGLSNNLTSVLRTAAGKYTALIKKEYRCPQALWMDKPSLVGAAGYDVYLTSIDKDSYATSAVTCDTKANTTDDDYFTLHDGVKQWTVVLDVGGTGDGTGLGDIVVDVSGATTAADIVALLVTDINAAAILVAAVANSNDVDFTSATAGTQGNRGQQEIQLLHNAWALTNMTGGIDGVYGFKFETWAQGGEEAASTGLLTFDTKANTTTGDYFILSDGHKMYGFELNTTGAVASHAIVPTSSVGTLTCDTKANTTDLDYYVLNDGQNKALLWFNVAGTTAAKYAKVSAEASGVFTCPTKANTTNEDYFTIWDGSRFWKIMLDTDASGDSTGTADFIVDISGDASEADVAASIVAEVMESTSVPTYAEAFMNTAVVSGNTVVFTCDISGYGGNGVNTENMTHASATITGQTGGVDAFPAEEFAEMDVSGATTAADISAIVHTTIAALTEVRITSVDATGSVTLANDETGSHGNCSQQYSETGSTLMDLTDMTGALDADVAAADVWSVINVSSATTAIDVAALVDPAIDATEIQVTATLPATPDGTVVLTNDNLGTFGNTQTMLSETGSTLLAATDMTGGAAGAALADTTDYDVYFLLLLRNSKLTFR